VLVHLTLGLDRFERHPGRTIIGIGVVFAIAYVIAMTMFPRAHGRIIDGDGIQYYAYLRSLVFDQDVNFINDYQLLYRPENPANVWTSTRTTTGHAVNLMSIGPALLWLPVYLLIFGVMVLGSMAGMPIPLDGIAAPFQFAVALSGIAYATAGAFLSYRVCASVFRPAPALWATLVAWLGSPAIYYSVVSPAYSHAVSLFTIALFVHVWLRTRGDWRPARYALLGALAGLAAVVRWQDAIILLLPLGEACLAVAHRTSTLRAIAGRLALMGSVLIVAFTPQALAWRQIYGHFILTPQGENFMRWTEPQVLAVLFSWNHGLFSWTPAIILAVGGLFWLIKRDRLLGWGTLAVLLTAIYVNAAVVDWWGGEAFGARRFVSYTVFFTIGLGALVSSWRWTQWSGTFRIIAVCVIVSNLLFLTQYQIALRSGGTIIEYPVSARQVLLERFELPWRLLNHQAQD
jgi:hypothetical protein|tara:strand:- start:10200 stop:11576 length:1377 start_codon:yes stop_codon:yes gene_type:complete